jgi:spore germination cell wall hydrolase CwlJ-like protein
MIRQALFAAAMASAGVSIGEPGMEFENAGRACIALTVFTEARGEPVAGQIAVAEVIRNRIADSRWGSDPCEVVAQLHQFHGYRDWPRPSYPWDVDREAWELALRVTDGVMLEGWSTTCGDATHFWRGPTPPWAKGAETCALGNHLFAVVP